MKKIILTISLFIVMVNNSMSQNKHTEVIYKGSIVTELLDTLTVDNPRIIDLYSELINCPISVSFKLVFNKEKSLFTRIEELELDGERFSKKFTKIALGGDDEIFVDLLKRIKYHKKNVSGASLIIKNSLESYNWKILKVQKRIGNFNCHKAILNDSNLITAWFTSEIPVSLGPRGYGGLPGMILELDINLIRYSIFSIENKKTSKTINPPNYGKVVTRKEYERILENSKNKRAKMIQF